MRKQTTSSLEFLKARHHVCPSGRTAVAAVALSLVLSGCLAPSTQPLSSASPLMRPEVFFAGRTEGHGTLTVRGGSPRSVRVQSDGRQDPDGTFRLDQTITFGDGKIETRTWTMRATDARTYTGKLSDANGDMKAEVTGNLLHLRYRIRQPAVYMEQWLYLQSDGQTVLNIGEATVLGIPWARLEERIVRTAP